MVPRGNRACLSKGDAGDPHPIAFYQLLLPLGKSRISFCGKVCEIQPYRGHSSVCKNCTLSREPEVTTAAELLWRGLRGSLDQIEDLSSVSPVDCI